MQLKTKMVKNFIPNLRKRLQELNGSTIEIGYFPQQPRHYSGLPMAGLFAIHSFGAPSVNIPARPILDLTFGTFAPINKNISIKNDLTKYFSKIQNKYPPINFRQVLENIGGDYVQKVRAGFGDTTKLESNTELTQRVKAIYGVTPSNNPLVWTGSLRDALSYSINGYEVVTPS